MATFDGTTGTLTDNGSTEVFTGRAVWVQCLFSGNFGGGVVQLEVSADNGNTWVGTDDKFNNSIGFKVDTFKTKYRFTLSGATNPSINYAIGQAADA